MYNLNPINLIRIIQPKSFGWANCLTGQVKVYFKTFKHPPRIPITLALPVYLDKSREIYSWIISIPDAQAFHYAIRSYRSRINEESDKSVPRREPRMTPGIRKLWIGFHLSSTTFTSTKFAFGIRH